MSSASPYLQDAWVRWANRGSLTRRDVELVLGGFHSKSRVLEGLRLKIQEHRRDDLAQLTAARVEASQRWDERLARLNEWTASSATLVQTSDNLVSWREAMEWFDRAQTVSRQFGASLELKIESMEKRQKRLEEQLLSWLSRLAEKEKDLNEIINRQSDLSAGLPVSAARKHASLDFIYQEREVEGQMSIEFKKISADIRRSLDRLSRPETWVLQKAALYPAYLEIRKNQVFEQWRPLQKKLDVLSEETLHLGLSFEEGRKRLRGIYEVVQKMKAVEPEVATARPLLHRLFNLKDD